MMIDVPNTRKLLAMATTLGAMSSIGSMESTKYSPTIPFSAPSPILSIGGEFDFSSQLKVVTNR